MLKPRTRDNSTAVGKPWVYFCAHPEDREIYFDELARQILARHDVAVWYPETAEADEEHLLDLCDMRLFIVPVTHKLLDAENRARDLEIPFAMENDIAILPILCEEGTVGAFNKTFGARHCLNRAATEADALPFEKKLSDFLSSVLLRDDQLEAVRNAFTSSVFLSYRKKDRKEARELMRLMHKDESCLDVGIWYDEYLTAGEDFNENIRHALEKSDVLTVAVTPNIVNESNYVVSTELPLARELGKPILAAEMVETDRGAFREEDYDVRDGLVDGRGEELSALLLEKIRAAASGRERCERHDFYMGLAYLYGIYTEVDAPRALTLLTAAAEGGDTDAMQKLADVYSMGLGVPRDFMRASEWMIRRVDTLAEGLGKSATASADEVAFFLQSVLEYSDSALSSGQDMAARSIVEGNLAVAQALAAIPDYDVGRFLLARMTCSLGSLLVGEAQRERGLSYLKEAESMFSELAAAERRVEYYKGIYLSRYFLGHFSKETEEKKAFFLGAYEVLRDNVDLMGGESDYLGCYGDVATALYQLFAAAGEREEANGYARMVEETIEALHAAERKSEALQLSVSLERNRAELLPPEEQADPLEKVLSLYRKSVEEDGDATDYQSLAMIAYRLGELKLEADPETALPYFEEGLAACRALRDKGADTPSLRVTTCIGLYHIGRAQYLLGKKALGEGNKDATGEYYRDAARNLEESLTVAVAFDREGSNHLIRRRDTHFMLCGIYDFPNPNSKKGNEHLRKAIDIDEQIMTLSDWESLSDKAKAAQMLSMFASVYMTDTRYNNKTEKYLRKSIALYREILDENDDEGVRAALANAYIFLANVYMKRGGAAPESALTFCEEAMDLDQGATDPALLEQVEIARVFFVKIFSEVLKRERDPDKKEKLVARGMRRIRREISDRKKRYETDKREGKGIASCYRMLAGICEGRNEENDLSDAAYYRELANTYEQNSKDAEA